MTSGFGSKTAPRSDEESPFGSKSEFLRIHRLMASSKALDDRMHILVKQGRAPFVGSARGHEGIQVAATCALEGEDDWLVPHYRGLGSAVARGRRTCSATARTSARC